MHITLDGSLLPALLVLALTIWACGAHVVALLGEKGKWIVGIIAAFALGLATVVTVLALIHW